MDALARTIQGRKRGSMRTIKKIAFLDRFYKRYCCGAKNHPSGWKKDKRITNKITRQKLKGEVRKAESEEV